jgi:ribonuclease Z
VAARPIEFHVQSTGGLETCIEVPGWDLCLDIGRCPDAAVRRSRILLTHGHIDHAAGLPYHAAMRDLANMPPPTYVVPAENQADIEAMLAAWRRIDRSALPCRVVGLSPGEAFSLGPRRRAVAFRSPHRVPTQGYALVSTRTQLCPELHGMPQEAIRARRLAGDEVSVPVDTVELAYTGDTLPEVIDREALVQQAHTLVIEATFLDDRVPVDKARSKGHVHLEELVARAELLRNPRLVLMHFSARYSHAEIERIVRGRLPPELSARTELVLPGCQQRAG